MTAPAEWVPAIRWRLAAGRSSRWHAEELGDRFRTRCGIRPPGRSVLRRRLVCRGNLPAEFCGDCRRLAKL